MASAGCCFTVYDSSGKSVVYLTFSRGVFTEPSVSELEAGRATSEDEVRRRASKKGSLMDIPDNWFSHIT